MLHENNTVHHVDILAGWLQKTCNIKSIESPWDDFGKSKVSNSVTFRNGFPKNTSLWRVTKYKNIDVKYQWRIYIVILWTCPRGPNSFNFMQVLGNFDKILCWRLRRVLNSATDIRGNSWSTTDHHINYCQVDDIAIYQFLVKSCTVPDVRVWKTGEKCQNFPR